MVSIEQSNQIQEIDINTRKELWDSLFLFVDFSRMKDQYPNMWNKEYRLLPLPKPYQEIKTKFTQYCQELNGKLENLINSFAGYFKENIYPVLESNEGDKTLLFRCKRLLNNKIIGESSSLFLDLLIFEREYLGKSEAKKVWEGFNNVEFFEETKLQELIESDIEKLKEGRTNLNISWVFYRKWLNLIEQKGTDIARGIWLALKNFLKDWEAGKLGTSEWKQSLKNMEQARDRLFDLGSESISDGLPFLQLGFIKKDTHEGLEIVCQNRKGFSLNNPYLFCVWFHQKSVKVYVVDGFNYLNPRNLYVSVYLREDWVWKDLPWIVNAMGSLVSGNHPVYHNRNLPNPENVLEGKHRLCFSFCQDLGNKQFSLRDLDSQINIKWALFRLRQLPDMFGGGTVLKDTDIFIPGAYHVEKVKQSDWGSLLTKSEEYDVFVAPTDYYDDKCLFKAWRRELIIDLPPEIKEQPHLPKHSSFQFCFLRDIIFSTNLLYMDIDQDNRIRATVDIYVSPVGTYFIFKSGEIPFKWKLDIRQGIVTWNLVRDAIDAVHNTAKSIGSGIVKFLSLGAIDGGKAKKPMEKLTKDLMTGKDGFKSKGLDREKINRVQEQQTARMFQSVVSTGETMIEPSIFYSNSVQFPYNLYDFFLRSALPRFEARIHISKNLFNNLIHNNNENPITYPLNITFEKLGNILKPGFYQSRELYLDYDPDGRMAGCFAVGVTFYEDKKKHFVNPDLRFAGVKNDRIKLGLGADFYTAQAIQEGGEPEISNSTRDKGSNYHQRGHYFIEYEDGTQDHWMALYPMFQNNELADGHTHGAFILEFPKPVKKFVDIYSCIGCGAQDTPLFDALHNNYRNGSSDSWDTIHKGLPYEPWFSAMGDATSPQYNLTVNGVAGRLGSQGDVWEKASHQLSSGKGMTKAYGYVPSGDTITWRLEGDTKTRIEWQKIPGHDDFDQLDWSPPAGSGGETEIPLSDPEINVPDVGDGDIVPDNDFPEVDPFDPTGGEPEIPPIEPDIPPDIDPADPDEFPDIDPPPIEPDPPEVDPNEPDPGQDPDTGNPDIPPPDLGDDDDDAD
ncbi:hypothetical protein [endosymbiont GvMRE of Glomus versiforme]|uniref:hypothetical protein n=1 Tax=endosymbiont GvMRE of Glomus versiforme TaxID=2039283 RepID=UPI000EB82F11|nr:hypothetical protein [endosymbiont GvMRE of Glomus versiforme]RHZ37769.1 hypothetical protein GvMRE_I1g444 [endosymbiont GvMRE of Glomus versiforme]